MLVVLVHSTQSVFRLFFSFLKKVKRSFHGVGDLGWLVTGQSVEPWSREIPSTSKALFCAQS